MPIQPLLRLIQIQLIQRRHRPLQRRNHFLKRCHRLPRPTRKPDVLFGLLGPFLRRFQEELQIFLRLGHIHRLPRARTQCDLPRHMGNSIHLIHPLVLIPRHQIPQSTHLAHRGKFTQLIRQLVRLVYRVRHHHPVNQRPFSGVQKLPSQPNRFHLRILQMEKIMIKGHLSTFHPSKCTKTRRRQQDQIRMKRQSPIKALPISKS